MNPFLNRIDELIEKSSAHTKDLRRLKQDFVSAMAALVGEEMRPVSYRRPREIYLLSGRHVNAWTLVETVVSDLSTRQTYKQMVKEFEIVFRTRSMFIEETDFQKLRLKQGYGPRIFTSKDGVTFRVNYSWPNKEQGRPGSIYRFIEVAQSLGFDVKATK